MFKILLAFLVIIWVQIPVLLDRLSNFEVIQNISNCREYSPICQSSFGVRELLEAKKLDAYSSSLAWATPDLKEVPPLVKPKVIVAEKPKPDASINPVASQSEVANATGSAPAPSNQEVAVTTQASSIPEAENKQSSYNPAESATEPDSPTVSSTITKVAEISEAPSSQDMDTSKAKTVLMIGDSMMADVAFSLKRWATKNTSWQVIDAHKVSSGLVNKNFYNWPKVEQDLISKYNPAIVVVFIGTNDSQDMVENKEHVYFRDYAWSQTYQARMQTIIKQAEEAGAEVWWIGLPPMRSPDFEKKISKIRATQSEIISPDKFVDLTPVLGDDGKYVDTMEINGKRKGLRAKDGIHLSGEGANKVVEALISKMGVGS